MCQQLRRLKPAVPAVPAVPEPVPDGGVMGSAAHPKIGKNAGGDGQYSYGNNTRRDTEGICYHSREQSPDRIAHIAPEPEYPETPGPVKRVRIFGDGSQKSRVHHCGAPAEQRQKSCKNGKTACNRQPKQGHPLEQHSPPQQVFFANKIGQAPAGQLPYAPNSRINGSQAADFRQRKPFLGQEDGQQSPHHAVVQVVDQPGNGHSAEVAVPPTGIEENMRQTRRLACDRLRYHVRMRIAHQQQSAQEARHRQSDPEVKRVGTQAVRSCQPPCREGRQRYGKVSGKLVQAHGQPPVALPREVYFHDHSCRPGKTLMRSEQHVGCDNPVPGRRMHQQKGHGQSQSPAQQQQSLAPQPARQNPGKQIGERFGDAEGYDK